MGYREVYDQGMERIRSIGMEQYIDLGGETRSQNRLNRAHIDSIVFEMRILGSAPGVDTSIELFGRKLFDPFAKIVHWDTSIS